MRFSLVSGFSAARNPGKTRHSRLGQWPTLYGDSVRRDAGEKLAVFPAIVPGSEAVLLVDLFYDRFENRYRCLPYCSRAKDK
jgi:hypothetical protein